MTDYSYPQELIKKVENRIRAQLDGNSDIAAKSVSIDVIKTGKSSFTSTTEYELDCKASVTQDKGKSTKGRLISPGTSKQEIESYLNQLQHNPKFNKIAKDHIMALPLSGFGADNELIALNGETITVTEQSPCGTCQGKGQSQCAQCNGRGRKQCPNCHSTGLIHCHYCQGRGEIKTGDQMRTCTQCQGRRQIYCPSCRGQKQISCTTCQSRGVTTCEQCAGSGCHSIHTTATPFLKTHSTIHIQELDDDPKRMAAKIGGVTLIKGDHAKMNIKSSHSNNSDETTESEDRAIHYEVTFPWAIGDITLNDRNYRLSICGKKGAVSDGGKFMDHILLDAYDLFQKCAEGQGNTTKFLYNGIKSHRVSRETLSLLMKIKKPKAVMSKIYKQYPIGLSKDFIQNFVRNGYRALQRMTRNVRYIALTSSVLLNAIIYYVWFMRDQKSEIAKYLPNQIPYLFDAVLLLFAIVINIIFIKFAGYAVTRNFIKSLDIKGFTTPPMGKAGVYGIIITIILWIGFMLENNWTYLTSQNFI